MTPKTTREHIISLHGHVTGSTWTVILKAWAPR